MFTNNKDIRFILYIQFHQQVEIGIPTWNDLPPRHWFTIATRRQFYLQKHTGKLPSK